MSYEPDEQTQEIYELIFFLLTDRKLRFQVYDRHWIRAGSIIGQTPLQAVAFAIEGIRTSTLGASQILELPIEKAELLEHASEHDVAHEASERGWLRRKLLEFCDAHSEPAARTQDD